MARRGDVVTAAVWLGLGAAIVVASWRMDRLRHLDVNPWSVPGLTPGLIGALMVVFALVLGWRALRSPRPPPDAGGDGAGRVEVEADATPGAGSTNAAAPPPGEARRTLIAGTLCLLFAGATLGRGVPFVIEGAVFVFAFTSIFSWRSWRDEGRIARGLAQTLVVSVAAAMLIAWLFESVFLVRLP